MSGIYEITGSKPLNALIVFAAFLVLSKAVDFVITFVLKRLARYSKTDIDDKTIEVIHRPVFFTVLVIGAIEAIAYLEPSDKVMFYAKGGLYTALTVIWGMAAIKMSNFLVEDALGRMADITGLGRDVIPLVENVSKAVIIALGLVVVLSVWKLNISPLLASAGIVGVAVALAAKDTLSNFFGGISIFMDRPYKIGDYIVLDGGERGEVMEIGIRSTRIRTLDGILVSIPNAIIANTKVVNESAPDPRCRLRIPMGVAYGSDIDLVEKVLLEVASANAHVLKEPAPAVWFREFGESSLNFELLCWVNEPALRGVATHELNSSIYKAFLVSGITVPFPQRVVHIREPHRAE